MCARASEQKSLADSITLPKKKPNNKDRFELNIRAFAASLLLLFEVFVYKCTNDDRRILLARVCIEVHVCEQKKKNHAIYFSMARFVLASSLFFRPLEFLDELTINCI